MRRSIALFAAVAVALLSACGGDTGDTEERGVLVDRLLRLGEDPKTVVEVRPGEEPAGLLEALNPEAVSVIDRAVRDADDQLALIADAAGLSDDEFASRWVDDRAGAFDRFASGADRETDGTSVLDELFLSELIRLPVHRPGDLVGSFRIERPDAVVRFWLIYDHREDAFTVERALARQLDETPWQVVAGQSTVSESGLRFQPTVSGDIEGTAIIRRVAGADAEGGPLTSVVYVLEVRPEQLAAEPEFELPDPRLIPEHFPAPFLVLEGMTPITVLWGSSSAGKSYQLVLLTRESAFDVAAEYRERLAAEGWELLDDRAVGFATVLEFQTEDGGTRGSLAADAFAEDELYTSVVVELMVSPRSSGN